MRSDKKSVELSEFFSIFPWPDDPDSQEGKEYFERTVKFMEKLLEHQWIKQLLKKKKVKILEICGGVGFGGIALAKILSEKNIDVEILITDLREDSLRKAENWSIKMGIKNIKTMIMDAKEIGKLKDKFDIALLYGLSTPHFNPWELVKLLSSVSSVLSDDGIFIVDESDRRYRIFLVNNYQWALAEGSIENKFCVSFQTGYSLTKGTFKRTYINFSKTPIKALEMETFMWGLSEVCAFIWTFFNDVDLIQLEGIRYFILGYSPRKKLKSSELKEPTLLK
ncbi:methyltransferase domain-containing protein [bacterium]|nr:methyltransferase domain-containing protein [bacterium]